VAGGGAGAAERTAVVGFLNAASAQVYAPQLAAFLKGLGEVGFVNGRNVRIEYRWAEDHNERLPALAANLVQQQVAVIAATSIPQRGLRPRRTDPELENSIELDQTLMLQSPLRL